MVSSLRYRHIRHINVYMFTFHVPCPPRYGPHTSQHDLVVVLLLVGVILVLTSEMTNSATVVQAVVLLVLY